MQPRNFIDLVHQALPYDLNISDLIAMNNEALRAHNSDMAMFYALSRCTRINWLAYLEDYPDLKAAKQDPIWHFIKHGIYEGRKLKSWHPLRKPEDESAASISIIVANYNNSIFLRKCINSLIHQTLRSIEIIIVDDCSQDSSLAIMNSFASGDMRIKIIPHPTNMGTHMARKHGVAAATGNYIMFLDADDHFRLDACEKALAAISRGYDCVAFNSSFIGYTHAARQEIASHEEARINQLPAGEYSREEALDLAYIKRVLPPNLHTKIFPRYLVQAGFEETVDGFYTYGEDQYEFLAITNKIRNLLKIPDKLHNYSFRVGISAATDQEIISPPRNIPVSIPVENFCIVNNLNLYDRAIKAYYIKDTVTNFRNTTKPLQYLYDSFTRFGFMPIIKALLAMYRDRPDIILNKILLMQPYFSNINNITIGIYCDNLDSEENFKKILAFSEALTASGHIPVLLCSKQQKHLAKELNIKTYFITKFNNNDKDLSIHIYEMYTSANIASINLLFYIDIRISGLVWDILLMRILNIPVMGFLPGDINFALINRQEHSKYPHIVKIFSLLDKLFVESPQMELFLHTQHVNAGQISSFNISCPKSYQPKSGEKDNKTINIIDELNNFQNFSYWKPPISVDYISNIKKITKFYAIH